MTPTERQATPVPGGILCGTARQEKWPQYWVFLLGLLGLLHGCYETLQGNGAPGGISILAMGPACQTNRVWHGCFPAVTIIPNFYVTGVLAIIVVWAAAIVQRKYGGLVLILLSIIQFIVGGGIISPIVGFVAVMAGMGIQVLLTFLSGVTLFSAKHMRSLLPCLLMGASYHSKCKRCRQNILMYVHFP